MCIFVGGEEESVRRWIGGYTSYSMVSRGPTFLV